MSTVENIITYALEKHFTGSAQNERTSSDCELDEQVEASLGLILNTKETFIA